MDDPVYFDAVAKLRWAADGEFSASLKPVECRALLQALERPHFVGRDVIRNKHTGEVIPVSIRENKSYDIGDPGDETDAR